MVPTLGARTLGAALGAIREQQPRPHLIVVAQGEVASGTLALADQVVELERPGGFAVAANAGIVEALRVDAPFVALINDDARLEPAWAGVLLEEFATDSRVTALQGCVWRASPAFEPIGASLDGCGIAWNRDWQAVQRRHGEAADGTLAFTPEPIFGASATAALFKSTALRALVDLRGQVFDERLETFYEDVELAVRLRAAGGEAALVPSATVLHVGSLTTARHSLRRWSLLTRNRRLVVAELLGEEFGQALPAIERRDRRDLLRAFLRGDLNRARGIARGRAAATRLLPEFAHTGAPLIERGTLARFGAPP